MSTAALTALLRDMRALVMRPDNDFTWSSWRDEAHAAAEIDGLLEKLARGEDARGGIGFLFLPTGPLQELAMSSGWGDTFLELADRYDAAMRDDAMGSDA